MFQGFTHSTIKSETELALDILQSSNTNYFHLTGSRFFGENAKDSDYDFFAENDYSLNKWLEQNRFQRDNNSDYKNTTDIGWLYSKYIETWTR